MGPSLSCRRDASCSPDCPADRTEAKPAAVRPIHRTSGAERCQPAHAATATAWQAAPGWPPSCVPVACAAVPAAATHGGATDTAACPGEGPAAQRPPPHTPRWPATCAFAARTAGPAQPGAREGADAGPSAAVPAAGTLGLRLCRRVEGREAGVHALLSASSTCWVTQPAVER